jgi:glutamate synthase (ferredoxin)
VLANWDEMVQKLVKVMLHDYKRVFQAIQNVLASGLSGYDALDAAFEENSRDMVRIREELNSSHHAKSNLVS